ncbi:Fatty acid amide hydrolase [Zea mays]|uniref:Fatty acid amide hydrolase n=1 Tax=Zea mays TaxID=4577 RepID=A0A1D6EHM7_MAIZE|nr:Fatty acid amide hydrolase [Zea mays]
MSALFSPMR